MTCRQRAGMSAIRKRGTISKVFDTNILLMGDEDLRTTRTIAALTAVMALAQPALAATSLCVETQSSGYNWRAGNWVPTIFTLDTYIVKEIPPGAEIGSGCHNRITSNGYSLEPDPKDLWQTTSGCYSAYVVGTEPSDWAVSMCVEYYEDGAITSVSCGAEGLTQFEFEPNGEFTLNRMYATRMSRSTNEQRDSLVLSVGKCSVIEP